MRLSAVCIALALAGCGTSPAPGAKSDWEKANEEKLAAADKAAAVNEIPPPPGKRGELIQFEVLGAGGFRFFVDARSVAVDEEGVVRYVLVARSSDGVDNVSFEGMRCSTNEHRIYALQRNGAWVGRPTDWRTMDLRSVQRWHHELSTNYFCPQRQPITSASEGVTALRMGGHPMTKGLSLQPQFGGRW